MDLPGRRVRPLTLTGRPLIRGQSFPRDRVKKMVQRKATGRVRGGKRSRLQG